MNWINILWIILACVGAFLLGSIPWSVWLGILFTGKDLREYNIGNPGGFNAMITFGPLLGYTITFADIGKGTLTIALIDQIFSLSYFMDDSMYWHFAAVILGPVCCILGHNYTPWLKFQGGRGMGVIIGTLLYINPLIYWTYMLTTAVLTQGLKLPSRLTSILTGVLAIPAAFFMPLAPPWTFVHGSLIVASGIVFLTQGLLTLCMWIAILQRNWSGVVHAFSGKEWSFSALDGQKISDDFETKKEAIEAKEKS